MVACLWHHTSGILHLFAYDWSYTYYVFIHYGQCTNSITHLHVMYAFAVICCICAVAPGSGAIYTRLGRKTCPDGEAE